MGLKVQEFILSLHSLTVSHPFYNDSTVTISIDIGNQEFQTYPRTIKNALANFYRESFRMPLKFHKLELAVKMENEVQFCFRVERGDIQFGSTTMKRFRSVSREHGIEIVWEAELVMCSCNSAPYSIKYSAFSDYERGYSEERDEVEGGLCQKRNISIIHFLRKDTLSEQLKSKTGQKPSHIPTSETLHSSIDKKRGKKNEANLLLILKGNSKMCQQMTERKKLKANMATTKIEAQSKRKHQFSMKYCILANVIGSFSGLLAAYVFGNYSI